MTFVAPVPEERSELVARLYAEDRATYGHVANFTQAFSQRADVYAAWKALNLTIKGDMDLRRFELVTIAAARRLRSSYCMLAHGSVLLNGILEPDELRAVVTDHRDAGLDEAEVAVMDLADKVAADATSVTRADVDRLRELGLSDKDVTDVVLAAAARCFFSKALDALGAEADAKFADLPPAVRDALTVGRPIAAR